MERVIVGGVNVRFGGWDSNFDLIRVLACLNDTEIRANFVITFCTPRDVMHIGKLLGEVCVSGTRRVQTITSPAYRIHVQDVDVSRCDQQVLNEGSDHMPRFELPFSQLQFLQDARRIFARRLRRK